MWPKSGVLSLYILACYCSAESYDGPSNQVVIKGALVFMECKDERDSIEGLTWRFHTITDDNPKTIVFNSSIVASSLTRVTLIARNDDNKQDDLLIPRADAEDAGTYYCMGGKQYTAELIVFDSNPVCHVSVNSVIYRSNTPTPVYLYENDAIVLSCTLKYWGNWPPTMKWTIKGGATLKTNSPLGDKTIPNKIMTSNHTLRIESSMDNVRFTCETYFVLDNKPGEKFGSTNIPVYQNTWESPTISVLQRKQSDSKSDESTQKSKDADPIHKSDLLYILVGGLVVFLIGLIFGIGVWRVIVHKSKKKKMKISEQQNAVGTIEFPKEYCEIDENAMDADMNTMDSRRSNARRNPTQTVVGHWSSLDPESCHIEVRLNNGTDEYEDYENVQSGTAEAPYENEIKVEPYFELVEASYNDDSVSNVTADKRMNKNYVPLDDSTKEVPGPPGLYNRLKGAKRTKPATVAASAASILSSAGPDDLRQGCGTIKPKLPTPETSSLSGNSN